MDKVEVALFKKRLFAAMIKKVAWERGMFLPKRYRVVWFRVDERKVESIADIWEMTFEDTFRQNGSPVSQVHHLMNDAKEYGMKYTIEGCSELDR